MKDYTIGVEDTTDESEHSRLKLQCTFTDERWTTGRSITGIDWSHKVSVCKAMRSDNQFPELVAASYNKNASSHSDPDGLVAIWNMHLLGRPEFVLHSPVGYPSLGKCSRGEVRCAVFDVLAFSSHNDLRWHLFRTSTRMGYTGEAVASTEESVVGKWAYLPNIQHEDRWHTERQHSHDGQHGRPRV